jgi:hypothetical protein
MQTTETTCSQHVILNPECYYFYGDISFFIEVLFQFLIQALNKFTYDSLKQGDKIINCLILWNNMRNYRKETKIGFKPFYFSV